VFESQFSLDNSYTYDQSNRSSLMFQDIFIVSELLYIAAEQQCEKIKISFNASQWSKSIK